MSVSIEKVSNKTYKMYIADNKICSFADKAEALKQSIYCMLNTERYMHCIYSHNYGLRRSDLYGKNADAVCSLLQHRIINAVKTDDRVSSAGGFIFDTSEQGAIKTTFTIVSIFGNFNMNIEVEY